MYVLCCVELFVIIHFLYFSSQLAKLNEVVRTGVSIATMCTAYLAKKEVLLLLVVCLFCHYSTCIHCPPKESDHLRNWRKWRLGTKVKMYLKISEIRSYQQINASNLCNNHWIVTIRVQVTIGLRYFDFLLVNLSFL